MRPEKPKERRQLGYAIRTMREGLPGKVSQEDFAEMCGVHRTYVGQVERGEKNISFDSLLRIAKALGLRLSALFDEAGL